MIRLTVIETILTEEAEDKVLKHYETFSNKREDEEDEWSRMGIKKPDFLKEEEAQEPKLEEEDFVEIERTVYVDPTDIKMVEELEEYGSKVYLSEYTVTVKERPEEVVKIKEEYLHNR